MANPSSQELKWFHVLTDPMTGNTYPTIKSMPDPVLEAGTKRVMETLRRHPKGSIDVALDCYNEWTQELQRRRVLRTALGNTQLNPPSK